MNDGTAPFSLGGLASTVVEIFRSGRFHYSAEKSHIACYQVQYYLRFERALEILRCVWVCTYCFAHSRHGAHGSWSGHVVPQVLGILGVVTSRTVVLHVPVSHF